jgi:hypothetical protein
VPFFTTHVLADKLTPHLKSQLNILQNRTIEGNHKNVVGEMFSVELVTFEWLKECLLQELKENEEKFRPEIAKDNGSINKDELLR